MEQAIHYGRSIGRVKNRTHWTSTDQFVEEDRYSAAADLRRKQMVMKKALRETQTLRARAGCSKVRTPPARPLQTPVTDRTDNNTLRR